MIKILNLGCGILPLKSTNSVEYSNVDMLKLPKVTQHDLTKVPYPFGALLFDKIIMAHVIEHIPEQKHVKILCELFRLLKPEGRLAISYPEFPKVAALYLKNRLIDVDIWKATIYGRGRDEWDRHKALMDTMYFRETLNSCGFKIIQCRAERKEHWNTVLICEKTDPMLTHEKLMEKEVGVNMEAIDTLGRLKL